MMRALDLFSGCGAEALGFSRAGVAIAGLCEIKPWLRDLLAERFPGVPVHDDVRTIEPDRVDVIAGGPPCQKTSLAAAIWRRRTGETLWPSMLRHHARTEWFVVEQPPGNKAWEAQVTRDLAEAGFHSARCEFAAADLGAPCLRRRVFILAHRDLPRLQVAWQSVPSQIERLKRGAASGNPWTEGVPGSLRVASGPSRGLDEHRRRRIEAAGDANPPVMYEAVASAILAAETGARARKGQS